MRLEGACVNYARAVQQDQVLQYGCQIEEPILDSEGQQVGVHGKESPGSSRGQRLLAQCKVILQRVWPVASQPHQIDAREARYQRSGPDGDPVGPKSEEGEYAVTVQVIYSARFAPDGQTVLYSASWDGQGPQLYSTGPDSSECIRSFRWLMSLDL